MPSLEWRPVAPPAQSRLRYLLKVQALVYDILPPTTVIVGFAIGLLKLSAAAQMIISL